MLVSVALRWQRPQAEIYIQDRTHSAAADCYVQYVQQDVIVIYLLKPPSSANTFLWLDTFYRLRLWLTCVFETFLCLLALWQCNSRVWTHTHTLLLFAVSKACPYYVEVMQFLKPSQRQPGLCFKASNSESNYSVSDLQSLCIFIDLLINQAKPKYIPIEIIWWQMISETITGHTPTHARTIRSHTHS